MNVRNDDLYDDDEVVEDEEAGPEVHTQAGVADGVVGDGEPMTGHGSEADQEEASEFWEEIGAVIEGQEDEDVHHADLEDEIEEG